MVTYKLTQLKADETEHKSVIRSDGWSIPFDPANSDYQAYLKFLAEGGKVYGSDEENT